MHKPFDKNFSQVAKTSIHPNSQVKSVHKKYHLEGSDPHSERPVNMYGSDFKSSLPQHPTIEKYTNYVSEYKGKLATDQENPRTRTQSEYYQGQMPAGNYRQAHLEQTVKPITTMFCENKKEEGDEK